jgi:WD40 repeat protein
LGTRAPLVFQENKIICFSEKGLMHYELSQWDAHNVESAHNWYAPMALAADEPWVAYLTRDNSLGLWNIQTDEREKFPLRSEDAQGISSIAISADGSRVAIGGHELWVWDRIKKQVLWRRDRSFPERHTMSLAFSPVDKDILVCLSGKAILVNLSNSKRTKAWRIGRLAGRVFPGWAAFLVCSQSAIASRSLVH